MIKPVSYDESRRVHCHICERQMKDGFFISYAIHPGAKCRENSFRICTICAVNMGEAAKQLADPTSYVLPPTSNAEGVSDPPFHQEPA